MSFNDALDPEAVDRAASVPLYHQLREALLASMREGRWQEGDMIPTEREICEAYKVSRITVRRAIAELVREGYLITRQGKGTFVARPKIRRHVTPLMSFSEEMAAEGLRPGSQLLSLHHERAVGDVAVALDIQDDDWIWIVERLRLADDEPVGISTAYLRLPPDVFLTPAELKQHVSLWSILRAKGITLARSETTIQAVAATEREAGLLQVKPGVPLLLVEGTVYSDQDVPVEYHKMVNRGDRYKYTTGATAGRLRDRPEPAGVQGYGRSGRR